MSVQFQDRFNDAMPSLGFSTFGGDQFQSPSLGAMESPQDSFDEISRFMNPANTQSSYGSPASGMPSVIAQLLSVISQLMNGAGGGQQYFSSASGGSNGDPHLSFNGNTWNDMSSETHLLDSNSIPGGYRLSTQTTAPNANGITYNQQATVTTNRGNTSVTLDKNGNATYTQNGTTSTLGNGQTVNLGNGETVSRNSAGSLTIASVSPSGGQITTTMSQNGSGVDVNVTASNVDLGGVLVNGSNAAGPQRSNYRTDL
jgi:hypothetical protein